MKKALSLILCVLLCGAFVFAQDEEATSSWHDVDGVKQSAWISVDFAYYFPAARYTEPGNFWAPTNGFYSGIEGRITPWYEVKVPTPLGESWLVSGDNLKFQIGLEVTPVSVMPKAAMVWEVLPFLVFSAGADIGTGWDIPGAFEGGMSNTFGDDSLDAKGNHSYKASGAFADLYSKIWVKGLFQFDVAALVSDEDLKDKLHIVVQADYKLEYTSLASAANGVAWKWQLVGDKFNGWTYDSVLTLGYMMPSNVKALKLVAVQTELDGRLYNDLSIFGIDAGWATFMGVAFNPTLFFQFDKHNSLGVQCRIKNRKSFATDDTSYTGIVNGAEWYFDRVALSYTYTF